MPAWLIWLIVAGIFAGGETVTGTFVLLMMSGGAAGAAIAAAVGASLLPQIIVFIAVTLALLWLVRPVAITGTEALIGREAVVLTPVTQDGGRVRLNGAEWSARSRDPRQELPAGTRVSVVGIDGATAIVWQDPFA
jgi:membrane protein implicated in regulation of membrane protease activity